MGMGGHTTLSNIASFGCRSPHLFVQSRGKTENDSLSYKFDNAVIGRKQVFNKGPITHTRHLCHQHLAKTLPSVMPHDAFLTILKIDK